MSCSRCAKLEKEVEILGKILSNLREHLRDLEAESLVDLREIDIEIEVGDEEGRS